MRHQCELLGLCRSSYYYQCAPETEENLALMRRLDELHLEHPVYGSRKLAVSLRREGGVINRKRVVRLLRLMGIEAIYAKPKTSLPEPGHQIYPYLLRDLVVTGAGPGLVCGYHVCAHGPRVHVFGGGDGLVEPLRVGLAVEQHDGGGFLCGRLGGDAAPRIKAGQKDLKSDRLRR